MARPTCAAGAIRNSRPRLSSPSPRPSLSSFVPLTLLILVAAAGCTFERRPETQPNADVGGIDTPSGGSATGFLERFQVARSGSDPSDLEGLIRSEATVMVDGRVLALHESADDGGDGAPARDTARSAEEIGGDAWEALAREPDAGGEEPQVTDSALFDGGALFVVRYDASVETILLARDSAGWGLRLLHRVTAGAAIP